jgi:LDH2 family malate/lactate/ureidoglycolate dehydrogenase
MPRVSADDLHDLVANILLAAGADARNANRVGDALVLSNLSGVDTHGVFHLPAYVSLIKEGLLMPTAWPEIVKETATTALVRGNWTFGHVVAKYATDLAVRKAQEQNVAVVSFMQATHIGRLGEYSEIAASQGMVCQVWASGYGEEQPVAVPYGGRTPALHTDPISMGFPGGAEPPMVLDFATTTIAGSKVRLAQQRGQQVPPNSLVDEEGKPTTDPSVWPAGGLLPFGGHKGYALMLANELMGRGLSGADGYAEAHRGGPTMRHQGVTIIVFKADLFQPQAEFTRRADELGQRMRAVPPAAGFDEVLVPGDLEERARATRRRDGIPVLDDVWKSLVDLAGELGVSLPSV